LGGGGSQKGRKKNVTKGGGQREREEKTPWEKEVSSKAQGRGAGAYGGMVDVESLSKKNALENKMVDWAVAKGKNHKDLEDPTS